MLGHDRSGDAGIMSQGMVIGQLGLADVSSPLRKAERRINRAVNPTTYAASEFADRVKSNHHFITTVVGLEEAVPSGRSR